MTVEPAAISLASPLIHEALAAAPLRLGPTLERRVWGGTRLGGTVADPVGESWAVHGGSEILDGPLAGITLDMLANEAHDALLGNTPAAGRFPLTVKLLDSGDWLSVQVHPDDTLAAEIEGPAARGKTEAWWVIEAEAGAEMITGPCDGATRETISAALTAGEPGRALHSQRTAAGDAVLVPAGTVHAMGPGIFAYEVQQASDITYRGYDWGRGRALDVNCFRRAANPGKRAEIRRGAPRGVVFAPGPFTLEHHRGTMAAASENVLRIVTALGGAARLRGEGWTAELACEETLVVAAAAGGFTAEAAASMLVATPGT